MDKGLEIALDQIGKRIDSNAETLRREIHGSSKGIRHYVDANAEILRDKMDESIKHQEIANGRVDKLEDQTSVWRTIQRNPLISFPVGIIVLGVLIALVDIIGIVNIFK